MKIIDVCKYIYMYICILYLYAPHVYIYTYIYHICVAYGIYVHFHISGAARVLALRSEPLRSQQESKLRLWDSAKEDD